jgi:hypothetical protein
MIVKQFSKKQKKNIEFQYTKDKLTEDNDSEHTKLSNKDESEDNDSEHTKLSNKDESVDTSNNTIEDNKDESVDDKKEL